MKYYHITKIIFFLPASNRFLKKDQLGHARQSSRKNRAEDVFKRDMDRSDPVVLSQIEDRLVVRQKKLKHEIPQSVLDLMRDPEPGDVEPEYESDEEGSLDDLLNDI